MAIECWLVTKSQLHLHLLFSNVQRRKINELFGIYFFFISMKIVSSTKSFTNTTRWQFNCTQSLLVWCWCGKWRCNIVCRYFNNGWTRKRCWLLNMRHRRGRRRRLICGRQIFYIYMNTFCSQYWWLRRQTWGFIFAFRFHRLICWRTRNKMVFKIIHYVRNYH